jgi:hypothetical protein
MALDTQGVQPWILERWELAAAVHQALTGGHIIGNRVQGGVRPTMTSAYRSYEKQQQLYADRANNPYPVNRPGDSAHNYGLAIDAWVPDKYWPLWHAILGYVGFRVPANDRVHAEWPNWRELVKATGVRL